MKAWAWALALGAVGLAAAADKDAATRFFRSGNAAYEEGRFEAAAADYRQAVQAGAADPRLYYNYGNALFRLNRLGPAILYYEKAFKLSPADEDIAFNLRFARTRVADKIPEPEANLLTRMLWGLHASYSLGSGVWAAYGLYALCFLAGMAAMFRGGLPRGAALTVLALAAAALLALAPSLAHKIWKQESAQSGIVLQASTEMRSGPGENYQVLAKVSEGVRFEIVREHGEWLAVKLANGKGGFVRAAHLGKV